MKSTEPTYRLTIRPLPDASDPDGVRRLRGALKSLLRAWRLRCIGIEPTAAESLQEPNIPPSAADFDHPAEKR